MSGPGGAVLLVVALGVLGLISLLVSYNRFVSQRNLIEESWGDVDVELKRRHDLVPNLVAAVQGYAEHERTVLSAAVTAREQARAHQEDGPEARGRFEDALGDAVAQVVARAEAYPDLKASNGFLQLQAELANTEDRIAAGRRFYNGNVRAFNTRAQTFPANLVAARFGFERRGFFELTDGAARTVPDVHP